MQKKKESRAEAVKRINKILSDKKATPEEKNRAQKELLNYTVDRKGR